MRLRTLSRWLGLALTIPVVATAQLSPVEEHLRRGVELRRAGHDDEAIAEFEEAHRLAPEPRTAAQLGLARQAVGRWLDADRLLREALASPAEPWVARNRAALDSALAVVGGHVGQLEVRGNVPDAEVRVEGVAVATLPMREPARVLAGMVSVEVSASGYETVSRRFLVDPRALVREAVELRRIAPPALAVVAVTPVVVLPPPVVAVAPRDEAAAARRLWGIVSLASAAAVITFGGVAVALREDVAAQYNGRSPACPPPPAPSGSACGDLEDSATSWRTAAWVALPVGAALAVTGAVLLLLPATRARRVTTLPCAPLSMGITCGFAF